LIVVVEDAVLYDMLYAVLTLDSQMFELIDSHTGRFNRPASMHPIVVDLVYSIMMDSDHVLAGRLLSWQQIRHVPFAEWDSERLREYVVEWLRMIDTVHERHCTRELFCSTSATLRKLKLPL
jgi:hypothetical protein